MTGVSPNEGGVEGGQRVILRGSSLGDSREDVLKVVIAGVDCTETVEYFSPCELLSKAAFTLGRGLRPGAVPHVYTYISRTRVFQDPGPLGTVFLTVPADLGPGPDQLNLHFKHTWLFAVSIERVKVAPELVVFLFLWILRHRRTELARRVFHRRCEARKRRFRFLQQILLTQELLLVPKIKRRTMSLCWRRRPRRIWRKPRSTNWWENIVLNTFTSHKSGIFDKAHAARKWACK